MRKKCNVIRSQQFNIKGWTIFLSQFDFFRKLKKQERMNVMCLHTCDETRDAKGHSEIILNLY